MKKYQNNFLSENFPFLVVKFSIYLNGRVFVLNENYFDLLYLTCGVSHIERPIHIVRIVCHEI